MKKKFFVILIIILHHTLLSFAQNTFSRTYDLDTNALRNYAIDLDLFNDDLLVTTWQFCNIDTGYTHCAVIAKFNITGDIINQLVLDTFIAGEPDALLVYGENFTIAGETKGLWEGRKTHVMSFDNNLNFIEEYTYDGEEDKVVNNNGQFDDGEHTYIYGILGGLPVVLAQVYKIANDSRQVVWEKRFQVGDFNLDCNDIQSTPDDNLAFILQHQPPSGAGGEEPGYQIVKINPEGDTLKTYRFYDYGDQENRLLVGSDGAYYFGSDSNPLNHEDISIGRINKLNADMNTLEWSIILPNNPLINGRMYVMEDYIEAQNGDIIACGRVWDSAHSEIPGIGDKNATWNGFIIRLTPAGEMKWLKIYKNANDLLPQDEFGRFRPSTLRKIIELESGHFVLVGNVYVKGQQFANIDEFETEAFHLWLLMVDENGCLEGEECQEMILLDGAENITQEPVFNIGTKWTYEYFPQPINPNHIVHSYITYEVTDTFRMNDTLVYQITNNRGIEEELMYQDNEKIYFWDYQNFHNAWQLTYDFNANFSYPTSFGSPGFIVDTEVVIDEFTPFWFGERGLLSVQQVSIENNGTWAEPLRHQILPNCGNLEGGLRLGLGMNLWDGYYRIGEIRCFEQDDFFYNFNMAWPFPPCDTVFTEVINSTLDTEISKKVFFKMAPNPASSFVFIDFYEPLQENSQIHIYSALGYLLDKKILKKGSKNHQIDLQDFPEGLYFVSLERNGHILQKEKLIIH